MNFETENIEFKAQFTEEIYKEVIAFANTDAWCLSALTTMEMPSD